jgi:hypothetical protein
MESAANDPTVAMRRQGMEWNRSEWKRTIETDYLE